MIVRTGLEIIKLYKDYEDKITQVEAAIARLDEFGYSQNVLKELLGKLKADLQALEATRFQALEPIIISTSLLGGK